ncbi:glycine/D-amino acid oxidase-like deaminating enzyme [Chelatococcus caeni]|uniref:Glycine/D-amino acid oxidase-like deaminating enzyme n=1 Tax=Chelatococcus caeni TaxID=1348468 RepID=A0A840C481_9HYPH|nr:FAD-binding oxidoreductase [Chelatococcus caeni]MBB4018832.1 glycine/D-amino acid oxidase-like deaminating enzyme [Chelatococcus caeni]
MHSRSSPHVVVVGAGIVGAAAAFFLEAAGARVTLVEAEAPAAGATGASDGAVSVASKRPGPMMALALEARAFYRELAARGVLEGLFHPRSTFLLARGDEEASLLERHGADLAAAGERVVARSAVDLRRLLPGLGASVTAGIEVPDDGHAIGYEITARFLARSRPALRRATPVRALKLRGDRVAGVVTAQGEIAADRVIVAAGIGSAVLIGLGDVLVPRKGQMAVTDRAQPSGPAIGGHLMAATYLAAKRGISLDKPHIGLVIDPLVTGQFLIGGSREENRSDRRTDAATIAAILREALDFYPPLAGRRVIRTFAGIRTACRDGLPIVGPHPAVDGLVVATGFEGDGICLGPLMGACAARLALGEAPATDVSVLSPRRFAVREVAQ